MTTSRRHEATRGFAFGIWAAALVAAGPSVASAEFYGERELVAFIFYATTLNAGTQYTIETKNATTGCDPVLHVLFQNGSTWTQVKADDNSGAGLNAKAVYTPSTTGTHRVWVRAYSSSTQGRADLYINGTEKLNQVHVGGERANMGCATSEELRVTGSERGRTNDTMVFLLNDNLVFNSFDNNSGPKLYSYLKPTTSANGANARVIWGTYPNTSGRGHLTKQNVCPGASCTDADNDGIGSGLEALVGTSDNNIDSDNDIVWDVLELWGNDGWSYSEGSLIPANNPTRRNVYAEVDFMNGGTPNTNRTPYANLAADVANIFSTDGAIGAEVDLVINSTSLPYTQFMGFGGCLAGYTPCVDFYTLKTANFSPTDSLIRQVFHYVVFGAQRGDDTSAPFPGPSCSSGRAEILGNDVMVTLDSTAPPGCNVSFSTTNQLGTFVHELGHNLNLIHNGNGNNPPPPGPLGRGPNSLVHNSVMNYNYQFSGITGRPAGSVLSYTYSFGTGGCAACAISPKLACINFNSAGTCPANPFCDCDVVEWGGLLNVDFYEGQQADYGDGVAAFAYEDPAADRRKTPDGLEPVLLPDSRPVPQEPVEHRRARIAARVRSLEARGERPGVDFAISPDGLHIYSTCR